MVTIALNNFIWARGAKLRVKDWQARQESLSLDHDYSRFARHSTVSECTLGSLEGIDYKTKGEVALGIDDGTLLEMLEEALLSTDEGIIVSALTMESHSEYWEEQNETAGGVVLVTELKMLEGTNGNK